VKYIARIKVVSDNRPRRVDAIDDGALARASACAWRIERGDDAVRGAHKAVKDIARIKVLSRDSPRRVDAGPAYCALAGACPRAQSIERRDGTVRGPHKAVKDVARIKVRSRDSPRRVDESRGSPPGVDESGQCALAGACTSTWNVERGEGAVRSAHEAVIYVTRINVTSHNRACRVEATG
jgi:hypothetical protein